MPESLFSRNGQTLPLGKCTEEVKTLLPETTKEALTALAFTAGKPMSEYVRSILMCHVHGAATLLRLANSQHDTTEGIGKV